MVPRIPRADPQINTTIDTPYSMTRSMAGMWRSGAVTRMARWVRCRSNGVVTKTGSGASGYRVGCWHGSLCFRRHRFPPEIIQHAIWLYLRFTLSYRDVEELLAERGLDISYETVRRRPAILGRRREPSSR